VGIAIMIVGIAFLIEQTTFDAIDHRFWPFILLAIGTAKVVVDSRPGAQGSVRAGVWLLFVGGWGLVNEFHLLGFDYSNSWPLMVVASGLMIVWGAFQGDDGPARGRAGQEP
jgi:hypothetical protein